MNIPENVNIPLMTNRRSGRVIRNVIQANIVTDEMLLDVCGPETESESEIPSDNAVVDDLEYNPSEDYNDSFEPDIDNSRTRVPRSHFTDPNEMLDMNYLLTT